VEKLRFCRGKKKVVELCGGFNFILGKNIAKILIWFFYKKILQNIV